MPHLPIQDAITLKHVQRLERCAALLRLELAEKPPPTLDEEITIQKAIAVFDRRARELRTAALGRLPSASGMQEA